MGRRLRKSSESIRRGTRVERSYHADHGRKHQLVPVVHPARRRGRLHFPLLPLTPRNLERRRALAVGRELGGVRRTRLATGDRQGAVFRFSLLLGWIGPGLYYESPLETCGLQRPNHLVINQSGPLEAERQRKSFYLFPRKKACYVSFSRSIKIKVTRSYHTIHVIVC